MPVKYDLKIIKRAINLRQEGHSWAHIAKKLGDGCTRSGIREAVFRHEDTEDLDKIEQSYIKARRSSNMQAQLRRNLNDLADSHNFKEDFINEITDEISNLKLGKVKLKSRPKRKRKMTVEALFSDLQLGKKTDDFNKDIAEKRIRKYCSSLMFKMKQHENNGYSIERVVLCFLGDIIESMEKAVEKGDPQACDLSTPEQVALVIRLLLEDLVLPLAQVGYNIKCLCLPGNHDHITSGMKAFKAGKSQLSWVIYKSMELVCEKMKLKNVEFDITENYFMLESYYGQLAVYEHGYKILANSSSLRNRLAERTRQTREYITYFRMGDKHNVCRFEEDTLVVNGAFFGHKKDDMGSDYAAQAGYSSRAAQVVFFHVPRKDDSRLTIYDSFMIQLGHIS